MAEIRRFGPLRHLRADPASHVLRYRGGRLRQEGRGLAFWFLPMSAGVAEVPVDDREVPFLFRGRSLDCQEATAQGVITFRVTDPRRLSERVDFTIDLLRGAHTRQPHEKLALLLTNLAQQFASDWFARTPIRQIVSEGPARLQALLSAGLAADEGLAELGLKPLFVRVSAVAPSAELEKALATPAREKIQQESDEAVFARRALAVDKERAIQEAELNNQVELAHREESLIAQRGQNDRRRAAEEAAAARVGAEAEAERVRLAAQGEAEKVRLEGGARADSLRLVEGARNEAERERMAIFRDLPPAVLLGLAAQELAGKLQRIDHLNVSPEGFGPALLDLMEAGTRRLGPDGRKK